MEKNPILDAPAFPPQIVQDNLGRIIAPIPALTKLEFLSALLLPHYLQLEAKYSGLLDGGERVTATTCAIKKATELLNQLNPAINEKSNLQIID